MAQGIFEQLAWLTNKVKKLCCAIDLLKQSGAGSYRVYTALLTQNGGDDPQYQQSGDLIIGVTYYIDDNASNPDFTNVGAPNNNVGTYFVATGTTPNSWGEAGLAYNTGAPVVTVLENTIGNIWFTYNSVGYYSINSSGLFTGNKTFTIAGKASDGDQTYNPGYATTQWFNSNEISIAVSDSSFTNQNNLLNITPIEIRVYN